MARVLTRASDFGDRYTSFVQAPQPILDAIEELDVLGKTRTDAWQIPRVEGELLYQLALATSARTIVEIGTSYGFSGLFWSAALLQTQGTLHTIDIDRKKFEASRELFHRVGVAKHVVNHLGDARQILPTIPALSDIVFIDADKPSTLEYFKLAWPNVRDGGSVLTDNALTHRDELAGFVRHVRARSDATSTELPVGNGLEWTLKLPR